MSLTTIQNSQSADNDVMNNNFYALAQGTIYPRGGTSLDPTTTTYSLGDSTHRWSKLYANSFMTDAPPEDSAGLKHFDYKVLSQDITTTRIEISGINGDGIDQYLYNIFININAEAPSTWYFYFNGVSTTTEYRYSYMYDSGGSLGFATGNSNLPILTLETTTSDTLTCFSYIKTHMKTGAVRRVFATYGLLASDLRIYALSGLYTNTSSTITSIVLQGSNTATTGHITIWRSK
jgi:hypothetical protein